MSISLSSSKRFTVLALTTTLLATAPASSWSQDSEPSAMETTETLDEALFSDLDPLPPPDQSPPRKPPKLPPKDSRGDIQERDPFGRLRHQMQQVQQRLTALDASRQTRDLQSNIVDQLDEMIARLREQQNRQRQKQQSSSPSSSQGQSAGPAAPPSGSMSNRPPNGSSPTPGQGGPAGRREQAGVVEQPIDRSRLLDDAWGSLPAARRQAMQSVRSEQFLPRYARQIEAYFERLAKDRKR